MQFRKIRNIFLCLAILSVVSLISFRIGQGYIVVNKDPLNLSLMWKVKDKLSQIYLDQDKIKKEDMEYGAIKGMVASLDDPYTVFLSPKENKSSNEDLTGEFGGVGISLGYKDKTLAVMTTLSGTPAEKAGIKTNDLILKITDKKKNIERDTTGISLSEAVELIRGEIDTEVTLNMYREGKAAAYDVVLKRDNIVVASVELEWKKINDKKVAWVKLNKFTEKLFDEWPEIVNQIKQGEGSDFGGIVLDLRNNPGGYLQASVLVASDFIKDGVIVKQQSSNGLIEEYKVDKSRNKLLDEKLVVLVNGGSASAAEILAGALKDYNRGKLVGEKTFGKGTVQQPEDFSDGSGLHITVAKWLLPNGANIHNVGIMPDIEVKNSDDINSNEDLQLNKAIEVLNE
ncbi:MAG: S41 family peptidase [Candidatus Shapirobacteria bacterium]|nr:S41 family peptidase [Candidatus Shapirobacteria bacterium]